MTRCFLESRLERRALQSRPPRCACSDALFVCVLDDTTGRTSDRWKGLWLEQFTRHHPTAGQCCFELWI